MPPSSSPAPGGAGEDQEQETRYYSWDYTYYVDDEDHDKRPLLPGGGVASGGSAKPQKKKSLKFEVWNYYAPGILCPFYPPRITRGDKIYIPDENCAEWGVSHLWGGVGSGGRWVVVVQIGMGVKFTCATMIGVCGADIMGVMWGGIEWGGDKIPSP